MVVVLGHETVLIIGLESVILLIAALIRIVSGEIILRRSGVSAIVTAVVFAASAHELNIFSDHDQTGTPSATVAILP